MKMIRRLSCYIALALSACISAFSVSAIAAGPGYYIARSVAYISQFPVASMQRLELTLAEWRIRSQDILGIQVTDMRSASNGFVFNSVPSPGLAAERSNT